MNKKLMLPFAMLLAHPTWSYDAFNDKLQRPTADKQDVDRLTRPEPTTLKGAEIKDFRDRLNLVQGQLFKDGTVPKGATLQADNKDRADSFTVKTPFNALSPAAQAQVTAKLPDAAKSTAPLLLNVALEKGTVRVDSVKPTLTPTAAALKTPTAAAVASPSAPSKVGVPVSPQPARVSPVSPLRASTNKTEAAKDAARAEPAVVTKSEVRASASPVALSDAPRLFAGKDVAAVRIFDNPVLVSAKSASQVRIPTNGPEPLVLQAVTPVPGAMSSKVTIVAPTASLPAAIVEQVTQDAPEYISLLSSQKSVVIELGMKSDATLSVLSVRPGEGDPEAVSQLDPSDVRDTLTDLAASAPAATRSATMSDTNLLKAAQQLAGALGVSPSAVVLEKPASTLFSAPSGSLAMVTNASGNGLLIQPITPKSGGASYSLQGRFADFSNSLQAEIRSRVEPVLGTAFLSSNPELIVETGADAESGLDLHLIAMTPANAAKPTPVVVWKDESGAVVRPSATTPQRATPSRNRLSGMVPAARMLIASAFGPVASAPTFQESQGRQLIRFVSPQKTDVVLRWVPSDRSGNASSFLFVGKNVEFTDSIRAAVNAKLEEALARGEEWAVAASKGQSDIQVEFLVDTSKEKPVVDVARVAPSPREQAQLQAEKMGLSANDYTLVDIGDRFVIVLDRGQVARLQIGDVKAVLRSPDGAMAIVNNPNQAKADASVLVLMSRQAIKANWDNLVRLAGNDGDRVLEQALQDNPKSDQFLVRVGAIDVRPLVVKALPPDAAAWQKSSKIPQ